MNVGCVPKKVMFNTAMHAELIKEHKGYGFDVEMKGFDWRLVYAELKLLFIWNPHYILFLNVCNID